MPETPTILAFDTSAAHCAAALLSGGQILVDAYEEMTRGQGERLMPLLQDVLSRANMSFSDLTAIGVGIGPGNFTGIRISVAAARGLALGLGIPAIGVSSLEAMAYGTPGPVGVILDARQQRTFQQLFVEGRPKGDPTLCEPGAWTALGAASDGTLIGYDAETAARATGARVGRPAHPLAHAIGHIAALRFDRDAPSRPAPLYIRAPDAAPARAVPPVV